MIINRIYENQNLLSLELVSFLFGLRTYQHSCNIKFSPDSLSGKCDLNRANVKQIVILKKQIVIHQNIILDPCVSPQHIARKIYMCRRVISVPPLKLSVLNTIRYI